MQQESPPQRPCSSREKGTLNLQVKIYSTKNTQVTGTCNSLDHLQVQSKFKDIVALEPVSHTWNRLLSGLPACWATFIPSLDRLELTVSLLPLTCIDGDTECTKHMPTMQLYQPHNSLLMHTEASFCIDYTKQIIVALAQMNIAI